MRSTISRLGMLMLAASVGLFGWEVYGRTVHPPHLWGIFILGIFGAYFIDAPLTQGFVTLILKVVPWGGGRGTSPTSERTVVLNRDTTVEVQVKPPDQPKP